MTSAESQLVRLGAKMEEGFSALGSEMPSTTTEISRCVTVPLDMAIFLVNHMVMIKVNIAMAKAHLSRYLKRVEAGQSIVLMRRNEPIAEIRPVNKPSKSHRPAGLCAKEFRVPASFDKPLPASLLDAFEGR